MKGRLFPAFLIHPVASAMLPLLHLHPAFPFARLEQRGTQASRIFASALLFIFFKRTYAWQRKN